MASASRTISNISNLTSDEGNFLPSHVGLTIEGTPYLGQSGLNVLARPAPDVQPAIGGGESVSTVSSFAGLHYGFNGVIWNGAAPPDVQVAAGPTYVVEMVNLLGGVYTKQGGTTSTFSLASFFGTGGDYVGDPKILYDSGSSRWFATLGDWTTNTIYLAISTGTDPTSSWYFYGFQESHGYCPDQPILGISNDKVAISVNDFTGCPNGSFSGAEYWIVEKSALLTGSATYYSRFGPYANLFSVHPVQALSATNTLYMVSTWSSNTNIVRLFTVTGVPPGVVSVQDNDIPISPTVYPVDASQLGSTSLVNVNDNRVLDAKLYGQNIWLDFNNGCVPEGDSQSRTCARYVEISLGSATISQDFSVGYPGYYYYYPALTFDSSGNMLTMFGYSSSSTDPSLVVTGQGTFDSPNSIEALQAIKQGTGPESEYCPTSGVCRYGDYFGAATDPSNGNMVWLAGEYGTGSGWSTYIEEVSLPSPGIATTVSLVPVGSSTPISSSNAFLVSYTFAGANKTAYDTGQPLTVTADSGTYLWFSATSSGSSSIERWAFDSQYPSVGVLAGSTSTLYYYDLLSEPAYYDVVNGGFPPSPSISYYSAPPTLPSQPVTQSYALQLSQSSQSIWALRGTEISVPTSLSGAQGEQWTLQVALWTVSQPNQIPAPIEYYHQFQVSFAFTVNNGGSGYSPPTVAYSAYGVEQVTGVGSTVWADSNSYQFVSELPGSSATERWEAGGGGTGLLTSPGTFSATYYHQYPLVLTYQVIGGGSPSPPQFTLTYLGQTGSYVMNGASPGVQYSVWVDAGSTYQLSQLLPGSTSTERWYGDGASGTATGYSTLSTTYYHQFYVEVVYSVEGGGAPSAPILDFTNQGSPSSYQMSQSSSYLWIDDNHWSADSTLGGSTAEERWMAPVGTNGTADSNSPISPRYFHQFAYTVSFSTSDNSVAQAPNFVSTQFGSDLSVTLSRTSTTYWLDNGAAWRVNSLLSGSNSTGRWFFPGVTNGAVSAARELPLDFLHQFYVTIQTDQAEGGSLTPTGWYNATNSLQLSTRPNQGWQFEYWNGTGRGSYSGGTGDQTITINGPISESATFYPGLTIASGGNGQVSYSWGSGKNGTISKTTTVYVPVGTNVSISATPSSVLFVFGGYAGALNSTRAASSLVVQTPVTVNVSFNPNWPFIGGVSAGVGLAAVALYFFRGRLFKPKPQHPSSRTQATV